MKRVVVTLDLDSKKADYEALDSLMAELGFSVVSPTEEIDLPHNTYLGEIADHIAIKEFQDLLWAALEEADLHPTALFAGVLQAWSLKVK